MWSCILQTPEAPKQDEQNPQNTHLTDDPNPNHLNTQRHCSHTLIPKPEPTGFQKVTGNQYKIFSYFFCSVLSFSLAFHPLWSVCVMTGCLELFLLVCIITWPERPTCPRARLHDRQIKSALGTWEMPGQITPHLHANGAFDKALATGSFNQWAGCAAPACHLLSSPYSHDLEKEL